VSGGVLAVFAHPDDESLLAGGTLAACAAAGLEVGLVSLTHGELGEIAEAEATSREDLGAVRARELAAAGEALGASWTECLDFPDGSLEWAPADPLRNAVAERIAEHGPGAVITFGSEGLYWHPDHTTTHRATLEAVGSVTDPPRLYGATWPAGLVERVVGELHSRGLPADLWGIKPEAFGTRREKIATVLDVSPFLSPKLAALRAHRTQLPDDHLLAALPDDLASTLLSREYYVRLSPSPAADDWLPRATNLPTCGAEEGSWG
jgi:LmbE family N-acetylglucosaminyl deacetylase